MRMLTIVLWIPFLFACNGSLDSADSSVDADGAHDDGGPSGGCEEIACTPGTECVNGQCVPVDGCHDIVCVNPGERCIDGRCVAGAADEDGDGYTAAEDCDDDDPAVNPGREELCNAVDDDCSGDIDEAFDTDGDGYTSCGSGGPADCNDDDPAVHPEASESCNGRDDDCDGAIDEDAAGVGDICGTDEGDCSTGSKVCRSGSLLCEGNQGPRTELCDGSDRDCDGARSCADSDCNQAACSATGLCFDGVCATPCETHNDGSVSCATLCGWCRGSCRGALLDSGEFESCSFSGARMWCYCVF